MALCTYWISKLVFNILVFTDLTGMFCFFTVLVVNEFQALFYSPFSHFSCRYLARSHLILANNYRLMAETELYSTSPSSNGETFCGYIDVRIEDDYSAEILMLETPTPSLFHHCYIPKPPPLPRKRCIRTLHLKFQKFAPVPHETMNAWDRLFKEGCGADVCVVSEEKSCILAHYGVLVSLLKTFSIPLL